MQPSASAYGKNRRLKLVAIIFIAIALIFTYRLYKLQILHHDKLVEKADGRSIRPIKKIALRGLILDREGEPLAISTPISTIIINSREMMGNFQKRYDLLKENCPKSVDYHEDCPDFNNNLGLTDNLQFTMYRSKKLEGVAKLLGMETKELVDLVEDVSKRTRGYKRYELAKGITRDLAEQISALNVFGISREDNFTRSYPDGELVGKLVGYTDYDNRGGAGIEKIYDDHLAGKNGESKVLINAGGKNPINILGEEIPVVQGLDVQISIDKRIQHIMRQELYKAWEEFKAKVVLAVMVNVKTGEILGMVSLPDGNPNNQADRANHELMRNHAITDVFEPGSVMKPIAMASALETGKITPNTVFSTSKKMRIGNRTVTDTHNYGALSSSGIIKKSSNTGMALISYKVGRKHHYEFMKKMGFGQKTGLNFPAEQKGSLRKMERMGDHEYATTFYGYGVSANALQLAQAYATIANNGKKTPLTLLKKDRSAEAEQVISPRSANSVLQMMKMVVADGGTGTRARTIRFTVAGKTGTAHTLNERGKYANRYRALFAGVAPADNPLIAVVVVVEDPKGKTYFGGSVAAPVFARIVEPSLQLLSVVPDKISTDGELTFTIDPEVFEDNDYAGLPEDAFE